MTLKEYRNKIKMTQEELARKTEINLRTYQNIEKSNNPDIKKAKKIADTLKASIEEIFFK